MWSFIERRVKDDQTGTMNMKVEERSVVHLRELSRRHLLKMGFAFAGATTLLPLLAACAEDDDDTPAPAVDTDDADDEAVEPDADDDDVTDDSDDAADDAPAEVTGGGDLIIGLALEPDSIDPHVSGWHIAKEVFMNLVDTMIYADGSDGTYNTGLADQWEANEEATEFTFSLRDNILFHDGTEFNAEAMKFSYDRIVKPETRSNLAVDVLGPYESSEVIDEYTIQVNFTEPFAAFLDACTRSVIAPVSPAAVEELGEDFGRSPVSTGPFKFEEWVSAQHIRLVRNPDYDWPSSMFDHSGPPFLDALEYRIVEETSTRVAAFEAGELHVIDLPNQEFNRFNETGNYNILDFTRHGFPQAFLINTEREPTDDIRVRQALLYAIDPQIIIDVSFDGTMQVARGPLNDPSLGYDPAAGELYSFDPDRARELLDEAGWDEIGSDGIRVKDGQRLELIFTGAGGWINWAEPALPQLAEVGIHLDIQMLSPEARAETNQAGGHHIAGLGFSNSDPSVLTQVFHSSNIETGFGWSRWRDDELDDLLIRAQGSPDLSEREELYSQIQMIIMENALFIPIAQQLSLYSMPANITGAKLNTRGFPFHYQTRFED